MKIGLNATCLNDRPSGAKQRFVGIYGEVIKRLPEVEFVVYNPVDCRVSDWFAGAPNVSARPTPLPSDGRVRKFLGGLGYWPGALRREKFDLFEGASPADRQGTHRANPVDDPRRSATAFWLGQFGALVFKGTLEKALRSVDHVITVSETMKAEIMGFFPGVPISVIYNGLDAQGFDALTESDLQAARHKYGLPEDYVLVVGHYERRKNYGRLIDAMALLRDRGRACNLVIIGNDSGERKVIEERVQSAKLVKPRHALERADGSGSAQCLQAGSPVCFSILIRGVRHTDTRSDGGGLSDGAERPPGLSRDCARGRYLLSA